MSIFSVIVRMYKQKQNVVKTPTQKHPQKRFAHIQTFLAQFGVVPKALKGESDREKLIGDRKREKAEEKLDKRRAKEDAKMRKLIDKEREAEKKAKRKSKQTGGKDGGGGGANSPGGILNDFVQSEKNFVPLFLEQCVEFIEREGLDSEGIYRVPGNRAHVDLLYQKMQEGECIASYSE